MRGVAYQCQLKGKVENPEDGTVRIVCEGKKDNIAKFVGEVRSAKKPIMADDMHIEYFEPAGIFKNFRIKVGDQLTEMADGFGTGAACFRMMLEKQDTMLEKQDSAVTEIRFLVEYARHDGCAVPAA